MSDSHCLTFEFSVTVMNQAFTLRIRSRKTYFEKQFLAPEAADQVQDEREDDA